MGMFFSTCVDKEGLWITEREGGVVVMSLIDWKVIREFGKPSILADDKEVSLKFPRELVVDEESVYIADWGNKRIVVCTRKGELVNSWNSYTPGRLSTKKFESIRGMVLIDGELIVVEQSERALLCFR